MHHSARIPHCRCSGFTLIELSIVLVIIGLVTGGILLGKDMIRQAELRSVLSDLTRYETAVQTFNGKYDQLPGDMSNAVSFWGADASCPNTPTNTTPKAATCNGDGNGLISTFASYPATFNELFRFWQQLANAGLIEGQYTGADGPAGSNQHAKIGVNVPASKFPRGGYSVYAPVNGSALYPASYFPNNYTHIFVFGAETSTAPTAGEILTGPEALVLDKKGDDGKPGTGSISTLSTGAGSCASTNAQSTAQYVTTDNTVRCMLFFKTSF